MKKIGLIGYFGAGAYSDDMIERVTKQLFMECRQNVEFDSKVLCRSVLLPKGGLINYLNEFDLLVHCGGSLLGKCTHPPINRIQEWANKVETPLAIFGAGYRFEPDKEPLNQKRRQRNMLLLEKAEVVSLRGPFSKACLMGNSINVNRVSSLADPVMAVKCQGLARQPLYLMGNVRNMPENEVQHSTTGKVQKLMAEIYDWLIDETKQNLLLLSFRHNIPHDNDWTGAMKIIKLMKNKKRVTAHRPPNFLSAFESLFHATFYFGQRLHPSIYAAVNNIPFVGLEYQFNKMVDWMTSVNQYHYIHVEDSLEAFKEKFYETTDFFKNFCNVKQNKIRDIKETAKKIMELI